MGVFGCSHWEQTTLAAVNQNGSENSAGPSASECLRRVWGLIVAACVALCQQTRLLPSAPPPPPLAHPPPRTDTAPERSAPSAVPVRREVLLGGSAGSDELLGTSDRARALFSTMDRSRRSAPCGGTRELGTAAGFRSEVQGADCVRMEPTRPIETVRYLQCLSLFIYTRTHSLSPSLTHTVLP